MPWVLANQAGVTLMALPASVWPEQRHIGSNPRARFVKGYGEAPWFVVQDGIREPETVNLIGILQTDRDETGTQALIDTLVQAAADAAFLLHTAHDQTVVEALPLLGALPITTEPEGVDGSLVNITLPLVPGGDWGAFVPILGAFSHAFSTAFDGGI